MGSHYYWLLSRLVCHSARKYAVCGQKNSYFYNLVHSASPWDNFICFIWPFEIVFESSFQVTCLYRLRSKTNFEFFQNRKEFQIRLNSLTHTAALQIKTVWWVRKLPIACTVLSAVWCRLGLLMADGQDGILLYFHLCNLDDKWNPEWHTSGCYADHRGWPRARLARRPPATRLSAELSAWLTDDDSLTRRLGQALWSSYGWRTFLKYKVSTKKIIFVENCHQFDMKWKANTYYQNCVKCSNLHKEVSIRQKIFI